MSAGLGIQDALVAVLATGALGWLVRRWWVRRQRKRCTCDGCPVAEMPESAAAPAAEVGGASLVSIEGLGPKRS